MIWVSIILIIFIYFNFNIIITYHVLLYFLTLIYLSFYLFASKNKQKILPFIFILFVLFFWGFIIKLNLFYFNFSFLKFFILI